MQRRYFIQSASASAAMLGAPSLFAQSWPSGPIRIVVGFPPGGGADALARVVGLKLGALWNQPVVIENKAGASGTLAAEYVAQQASDGTTLLLTTINSHALAPAVFPKLRYHAERDFVPVALLGLTPNLLIAGASQPAKTVKDIVALCKAQPGRVTFGSAGPGTAQHFALELFKLRAKVDALHVPYKGSGPLLTDLVGGQIQYSFESMTASTPHVKSGRAIAVAQTRSKRVKAYPDVPTMQEQGFAGFETVNFYYADFAGFDFHFCLWNFITAAHDADGLRFRPGAQNAQIHFRISFAEKKLACVIQRNVARRFVFNIFNHIPGF